MGKYLTKNNILILAALISFAFGIYSCYEENYQALKSMIILTIAFLFFANLEKIVKIRIGGTGFEAETRDVSNTNLTRVSTKIDSAGGTSQSETLKFSLSSTSHMSRLFACFLLKTNKAERPIEIEKFVNIVRPLVKMSTPELKTYVYGILHGMACSLSGCINFDDQTRVRLKTLPNGFETYVKNTIESLKKQIPIFTNYLNKIDNIS